MGYPRTIQPLIIEDEASTKKFYQEVFAPLIESGIVASPRYAYCVQDAKEALNENRIYHLVILDLRLPDAPEKPPHEGLEFGTALLADCIQRDAYPIPALLVISGHLGQANQRLLAEQVNKGFAYGQIVVKGPGADRDIQEAVQRVQAYSAICLHGRDMGVQVYPPLSPREEDLLRRCVLQQEECEGIEFEWWSAEYQRLSGASALFQGWTKTLMGNFLMRGVGISHPTFFKLAPAGGADTVVRDAGILQHKLPHIKKCCALVCGNRSLLVTQKVGESPSRPWSLATYLAATPADAPETAVQLARIAEDIAAQVKKLGDAVPNQSPMLEILWPHHIEERIGVQWESWGATQILEKIGPENDPLKLLTTIRSDSSLQRFTNQTCLHGDLNCTNVALDRTPEGVRAYIFDACGSNAGVNVRDLAMLEITTLLHQTIEEDLSNFCEPLYGESGLKLSDADIPLGSDRERNTFRLILEIRRQALQIASPFMYALMVFDNALMQLGGLSFSPNKIQRPQDAAVVAALTARLVRSQWPPS